MQVDLVEASGACRNEFRPAHGEVFQHIGIDNIVDKDADSREPGRKGDRLRSKQRIEGVHIMPMMKVCLIQQHAFVSVEFDLDGLHVRLGVLVRIVAIDLERTFLHV